MRREKCNCVRNNTPEKSSPTYSTEKFGCARLETSSHWNVKARAAAAAAALCHVSPSASFRSIVRIFQRYLWSETTVGCYMTMQSLVRTGFLQSGSCLGSSERNAVNKIAKAQQTARHRLRDPVPFVCHSPQEIISEEESGDLSRRRLLLCATGASLAVLQVCPPSFTHLISSRTTAAFPCDASLFAPDSPLPVLPIFLMA